MIMYHLNIRGLNSKKGSLAKMLKNRKSKSMGGVATFVNANLKDDFMKIKEGDDDDEFLITRHSNFKIALNVINVYGEQEGRVSKNEIQDRWGRLLDEIYQIEKRNEDIILIGDLNKHIGCDELGVENNHPKISFGGQLLRALLATGDYICLNNNPKCIGGPFTRYDPSCPTDANKMSCLDFVIISKRLLPFIESVVIDSKKEFSPVRPISKLKGVTSDHFPMIVTFKDLPLKNAQSKSKTDKYTMWNTNKDGGWQEYENLTRKDDIFENICMDIDMDINGKKGLDMDVNGNKGLVPSPTDDVTESMNKLSKVMTKVKHTAFGKVKVKRYVENKSESSVPTNKSLLEKQRVDIEKEFENINKLKATKGKTAAIFKTFDKIKGKSKDGPELVAMKDPETKEFIFSPDELKKASLKYCVNLLDNKAVDPDFADEIECENMLHYLRMKDDSYEDDKLHREDLENRLKKMDKDKYRFLLNAGDGLKNCVFRLFSQVWKDEVKPQQWRNTVIIQLYKSKGEACCFDNQRNIHTKEEVPKLF